MPVVSRSDCTQTNVQEYYNFVSHGISTGFTGSIYNIQLSFEACQGANNKNNDLEAFVQQLVNDNKVITAEQDIFKTRIVGNNKCSSATTELLEQEGFEIGYTIDSDKWTFIAGEGFDGETPIMNARLFKEMIETQDVPLVRRVCVSELLF